MLKNQRTSLSLIRLENRNERVGKQFEGSLERQWTGLGDGEEMMMYFFLTLLCTKARKNGNGVYWYGSGLAG